MGPGASRRAIYAGYDAVDEEGRPVLGTESNSIDCNAPSPFRRSAMLLYHCRCHGAASAFHRSAFEACGY